MAIDVLLAMQYRINPQVWGGMDEFVSALKMKLDEQGVRMAVAVPMLQGTDASHYQSRGIPCKVLEGPLFADSLSEFCSREPVTLLHTHFMPTLSAKYRKLKGNATAIISTEHMSRPLNGWSLPKSIRTKASSIIGRRFVNELIHVSHYLESENVAFFGSGLRAMSSVIHNGVRVVPLTKSYPSGFGVSRPLRLVSAGRLVPEKGFAGLVDLVAGITESHGEVVRLDILGDGPERAKLQAQAGRNLDRSIFFHGFVNDVSRRLREADIYVHASSQEAFPFVLLEAGEAGLPSIVYSVGGNSEIVADGCNGRVCSPGKLDEILQRVLDYIDCPALLRVHGENARHRVESEFSVDRMVAGYASIYQKYFLISP